MSAAEALRLGFIVAGPTLSVAGLFFALSISASPYHNIIGKALAWPLSPIAGLLSGAYCGGALLPDWGNWGVVWFFGPGFFLVWMVFGTLAHDDLTHLYAEGAKKLWPVIVRKLKEKTTPTTPNGKRYKARADYGERG